MSCCCEDIAVYDDAVLVANDVLNFSFDGGIVATQDAIDPTLVHIALGGPGAVSLQLAYEGGETITTDDQGPVEIIRGAMPPDPGSWLLMLRSKVLGPNILWMDGAPTAGSASGFFNLNVTDACSVYTHGALGSDGGSTVPGLIATLGWTFMIGSNSDIGAGAKNAAYVSFANAASLDHFQGMRGADTGFRVKIKRDGGYDFGDGAGATQVGFDQTGTVGELGFSSSSVLGLRLSATATGAAVFKSDEPGAADNRPPFDFVATANIPAGTNRLIARFGENGSVAAADIRMLLNSDGGLRVRGVDPSITGENTTPTALWALGISGGAYTQLTDNVSGSGMKFVTTGNPGAGVLAFQFNDGGGTLLQVDGDGDCVVTKDIEAAGGYQKTIGIWTHALVANQTDIDLTLAATINNDWTVFRAGSITGIATRLDAVVTAGTLTINVKVNGVIVFTSVVTAVTTVTTQAKDVDAIVATDLIRVSYTTSAGFAGPATASVEVEIEE